MKDNRKFTKAAYGLQDEPSDDRLVYRAVEADTCVLRDTVASLPPVQGVVFVAGRGWFHGHYATIRAACEDDCDQIVVSAEHAQEDVSDFAFESCVAADGTVTLTRATT